ncbi:DUF6705 family protein [Aquimarina sp. 2201CG14-23]|uniref:DUF6705 family protein n=1 Tax=Aquimarina mycalae TaxID=3040073 RepID=UPI002477FAEC|nr:DUF6705 family protein [Aquimarina sp. 2201CG14-23]MDH7444082.1 hypothetical protein [Aquimarina sp. 2201CG14-23]
MKIIIKLLFVLFVVQTYSQTIIPLEELVSGENTTSDYYYKDTNGLLDKFLGTWRYQTSNELFEITFTKVERIRTGMGYYIDELNSRYKYIENGEIIFDTYSPIQPSGSATLQYISGRAIKKTDFNSIVLTYDEPGDYGDYGQLLYLKYISGIQKLDWYVDAVLYDDPDNPGELTSGYKIPYKMILTKIN